MNIDIKPKSMEPVKQAYGLPSFRRAAPVAPQERSVRIKIDRLQIEGLGSVNSQTLSEGFRDTWIAQPKGLPQWVNNSGSIADAFQAPLNIEIAHTRDGRQIGVQIANAILQRVTSQQR